MVVEEPEELVEAHVDARRLDHRRVPRVEHDTLRRDLGPDVLVGEQHGVEATGRAGLRPVHAVCRPGCVRSPVHGHRAGPIVEGMTPRDCPRRASDELHARLPLRAPAHPRRAAAGRAASGSSDVLTEHLGIEPHLLAVVTVRVRPHRLVDADIALAVLAAPFRGAHRRHRGGDARHHMSLGDLVQHGHSGRVACRSARSTTDRMPTGPRQGRPAAGRHRRGSGSSVSTATRSRCAHGHEPAVRPRVRGPSRCSRRTETCPTRLSPGAGADGRAERHPRPGRHLRLDPYGPGMAGMTFIERPTRRRRRVVLPDGVLDRVAHHVIGMGEHRERLQAHGQHLKRGVLLYGPPGTGKTHTVRYLLSATPGTTAVLLSGGSLRFIHDAAKVARAHQPAIVVLEDCDLVAEDRSFGMGPRRCSSRCSTLSTASTPTPTSPSCSRRTASRTSRSRWRSARDASTSRRDPAARRRGRLRAAPALRRAPLRDRGDVGAAAAGRGHDGLLREGARAPGRARRGPRGDGAGGPAPHLCLRRAALRRRAPDPEPARCAGLWGRGRRGS